MLHSIKQGVSDAATFKVLNALPGAGHSAGLSAYLET